MLLAYGGMRRGFPLRTAASFHYRTHAAFTYRRVAACWRGRQHPPGSTTPTAAGETLAPAGSGAQHYALWRLPIAPTFIPLNEGLNTDGLANFTRLQETEADRRVVVSFLKA